MRNTLRFLLSNLYDFDPAKDNVAFSDLHEIDRWALAKFAELSERITRSYERYEFHAVYHGLYNFCGTTISSLYMDVLKDRLYCSLPNGPERRAAQTVIYRILDGLLRLMSPVLCFTAAEAWEHLHRLEQDAPLEHSIFFADFAKIDDIERDAAFDEHWNQLLTLRGAITKVLEGARQEKMIGLALDAEVILRTDADWAEFVTGNAERLRELCIVSSLRQAGAGDEAISFVKVEGLAGLEIAVVPAPGAKCERCWTISPTVGEDTGHPGLCARCATVVRQLAA
jgi:isoleucyl-tRNA synthetase